ncbi:hypothetical protein NX059_011851 [Plenodomus lindquistii]|nr:hypothetical protein NX059_011851 [Plenodomus lindquistii]
MFLLSAFVVLWLAFLPVQAVLFRRDSAKFAAPFSNGSLITTTVYNGITGLAELPPVALIPTLRSLIAGDISTSEVSHVENVRTTQTYPIAPLSTPESPNSDKIISVTSPAATLTSQRLSTANVAGAVSPSGNATITTSKYASGNASCTVNVPSASLNLWYPPTYSFAVGTMTTIAAGFSNDETYTLIPQTTTFDVSSALETNWACTTTYSYRPDVDWTAIWCSEYTDKPVATITSIVYRSAYSPFPVGDTAPITDAMLYDIYTEDRPSATTTLSVAPNVTRTETSATPFVHFTAYEVEYSNRTETVHLPSAFVYPYWLNGTEHEVVATGPLPQDFLDQIAQPACAPGKLQAVIIVVIVVDLYYENLPGGAGFGRFESTALGFDDPIALNDDQVSSKVAAFTVADWDLTALTAKPGPTSVMPQLGPDSVPTTAGRNLGNAGEEPQPSRVTVGTIGILPIVIGPSSQVVIGSQTLRPGGAPIVVGDGTPVSLAPSATAIIVGGATSQLPRVLDSGARPTVRPPPLLTIGSATFTANAATQFLIAPGQTLSPGSVVTLDGTRVSLAPSASFVVIGVSTQALQAAAQVATIRPQIVVGGSTITAQSVSDVTDGSNYPILNSDNAAEGDPGPWFVVSGQTLAPGGSAVTVSGTTLSLAPSGSFLVINGVTSAIQPATAFPTVRIGDSVFTATSGDSGHQFIVNGQTLAPGGPAITVLGTTLSLAPSAPFIVVNGVTSTLHQPAAAQITAPPLTIGDSVFRPLPGTAIEYMIFNMLLTPGASIVASGVTIFLAPGVTALVVNGRTSHIAFGAQGIITNAPLLTVGSRTYTAVYGTTFVIDGQTLIPGGAITVDGTTISLAHGATELLYGSSGRSTSSVLFPATTTRSQSVTPTMEPSAGANGGDGRVAATSSRADAARSLDVRSWAINFLMITLGTLLV